uniref:Uncharacterized protein n=1 Tax=Panagrolaimus davidi TaxID=227884 RepID=A0A914QP78_9BILA
MWLTHKNKEDDFIRRKLEERMFDVQKRRKKFVKNDVVVKNSSDGGGGPPAYTPGTKIKEIGYIDSEKV